MDDTSTNDPVAAINRDCTISAAYAVSATPGDVTVAQTDDGRVLINAGALRLFLGGWEAELLSRELLSAAVRVQHAQREGGE
jgi:hypothetical protein